jgi:ribosome-binding factor A
MTRKKIASAKAPTQRMLRIGELIRHRIAELLVRGDIHDDVIAGHIITIPECAFRKTSNSRLFMSCPWVART